MTVLNSFYKLPACLVLCGVMCGAQALPITYTFEATVAAGPYTGTTGNGSFTFEVDEILGAGEEDVSPSNNTGFLLDFTFLGTTYTHLNDIDFPLFPVIALLDSFPVEIDFQMTRFDDVNPTAFSQADILAITLLGELVPGQNVRFIAPIFVTTIPSSVPEPTSLALLGLGLAGLGYRRRK